MGWVLPALRDIPFLLDVDAWMRCRIKQASGAGLGEDTYIHTQFCFVVSAQRECFTSNACLQRIAC